MQPRAHPRYAIELDAQLDLDGGPTVQGRTQDISRGGFCILSPPTTAVVAAGTPSSVRMALVFSENEFSEQLALRATVIWCTALKQGVQVGVKFEALDAQAQSYLDLFMKFLEEGREAAEEEDDEEAESDEG
jgi:hypothetical protein